MARHPTPRPGAAAGRLSRACAAVLAAALLLTGCARRSFQLAGTVTLASVLRHRAPQDNAVLFVIAKNRGEVPVAVHRIVNPQFPAQFCFGPEDLIVPDLPPDTPLRIEIEMNAHGTLGRPARGDLEGAHPNLVYPGDRRVDIVIDRQV